MQLCKRMAFLVEGKMTFVYCVQLVFHNFHLEGINYTARKVVGKGGILIQGKTVLANYVLSTP